LVFIKERLSVFREIGTRVLKVFYGSFHDVISVWERTNLNGRIVGEWRIGEHVKLNEQYRRLPAGTEKLREQRH